MNKYIVSVKNGIGKTASVKAKEDVKNILMQSGFSAIDIILPSKKLAKLYYLNSVIKESINQIKPGDLIVYQYPDYSKIMRFFFKKRINEIEHVTKYIFLHDVNSLRNSFNNKMDEKNEILFFKSFDKIVSHNSKMSKWLVSKGVEKDKVINLDLFDYLEEKNAKNIQLNLPIIFAGNLGKSVFLENISFQSNLNLYGINPPENLKNNIKYYGSFDSNRLVENLEGSFGLVWDGESIERCLGDVGEYMKFNNPHKASLYLSAGLPVIIWKEAALSDFIVRNNLGIAINNLSEIDDSINKMTGDQYDQILKNVQRISKKVRSGYYTRRAIQRK